MTFVTKLDCSSTFCEEEKPVKFLEQDTGRLVDGAENSLTRV